MTFEKLFDAFAQGVHLTAIEKGWWDRSRNELEIAALIHSEISEMVEAARHGDPPDDKIPEYSGVEAELADVIIRIMDFAVERKYNITGALIAKAEFNKTRPVRHGGKKH